MPWLQIALQLSQHVYLKVIVLLLRLISGNTGYIIKNFFVGVLLFSSSGLVTLAHANPTSNQIDMVSNNATIAIDKASYYQGEYMEFNYTSLTSVGISKDEFIRIYPEDVTNYYSSSQNVFFSDIRWIGDYGDPTGVATTRIYWPIDTTNSTTNSFRAVLYLTPSVVLTVSDVFDVVMNNVTLSNDKTSYYQGEYMMFSYVSLSGVNFQESDYIQIYPESITDFSGNEQVYSNSLRYGGGSYGSVNGTAIVRLNWPIDGKNKDNKFRAVIYLQSGFVLSFTDLFEVHVNDVTLVSDKSSYYHGEDMVLNYSSTSVVPWQAGDYIKIYPLEISDYSQSRYVYSSSLRWSGGDYGQASGTVIISLDWPVAPDSLRSFKAVAYLGSSIILGTSNEFMVDYSTRSPTVPSGMPSTLPTTQPNPNPNGVCSLGLGLGYLTLTLTLTLTL